MGNVSTRPRKPATPVTAAATAVTASKADTAAAPIEEEIFQPTNQTASTAANIIRALEDAAVLLERASQTDEPRQRSGDPDRLLLIASVEVLLIWLTGEPDVIDRPTDGAPAATIDEMGTASAQVEEWRPAAIAARDAVINLLSEAIDLDEAERMDSCGFAKRMMDVAMHELGHNRDDAGKDGFEFRAFNAEALIYGALELTTDPVSLGVQAKLQHALAIINKLTDTLTGGADVAPILTAIHAAPATPRDSAATEGADDEEQRHQLAFDANYQIRHLAQALIERIDQANCEMYAEIGMAARINQLTDIVFYAARLYAPGYSGEAVGAPSLNTLQRMFMGHAS